MKINKAHDIFFKEKLVETQNAIAFLECTLPESIQLQLRLSTLVCTDNTYITKQYHSLYSDIVFQCHTIQDEELYCSILVEHKSYKDSTTIFQIGAYIFEAYRTQLKKKKPLKLVVPIIYYNGKSKWVFSLLMIAFVSTTRA